LAVKEQAKKEAARRGISAQEVEKEIYEAQRQSVRRTDTGIRKDVRKSNLRAVELDGGDNETRIFDGSEELEEDFSLKDARAMFRGEDWLLMTEALNNLDAFAPPAQTDDTAVAAAKFKPGARTSKSQTARGSFSAGVTPAELSKALAAGVGARPSARVSAAVSASEVAELKKLLIRKYGSITSGYRHVMAPDGNGRLAFSDFGKGLRLAGFLGNAKNMFQYLDTDNSGIVTYGQFEPELGPLIKNFRNALFANYGGTYDTVWAAIDANGNNQLDEHEFEEVCMNVGMAGASQELFKEFREHPSRKFLTLNDIKSIPRGY
jgi:Ca2+-binding EF-hand superfamily protein